MTQSVKAIITPSVLIWARIEAGFSPVEVAQKLQIDAKRLEDWEQGNEQPTISQLRKIANIYKRPIAVFYLPAAPLPTPRLHDYRRLPSSGESIELPQLKLEIRRAYSRRETALDLYNDLGETPPTVNKEISLDTMPEDVGISIRDWLRLTYAEQISWKNPHKAFNWWRSAIESRGILVFQVSGVSVSEMRGFSIHNQLLPIIAVNIKDQPRGRIFTLVHELTHILLHEGGICTLKESRLSTSLDQKIEVFCNAVAGAAIVPNNYLDLENTVLLHSTDSIWTDSELQGLGNRYQASRETILRRLLLSGRTTEEFYQLKRREFVKEYDEIAESKAKENIVILPAQKAISQVGVSYARLVLNGYNQGLVNATALSESLGMKLKHLSKLEQVVFS